MNLSHRLLSSVFLAGTVFSITALPLVTLGSKPVTIQLEERPVFVGQLRELAGPYLALATSIGLGVGVVSLAVSSWRHAAYKLEQNEAEIAALKQQLSEKQTLVERLRFADTKLQSSGLEQFLQGEELVALRSVSPLASTQQTHSEFNRGILSQPNIPQPAVPQPTVPQTVPDFHRPTVPYSRFSTAGLEFFLDDESVLPQPPENAGAESVRPIVPETVPLPNTELNSDKFDTNKFDANKFNANKLIGTLITEPVKIQPAKIQSVSSLPAAQSFSGFVRPDLIAESTSRSHANDPSEQSTQLNELLGHLKQVMTQIERLQTSQSQVPGSQKGS